MKRAGGAREYAEIVNPRRVAGLASLLNAKIRIPVRLIANEIQELAGLAARN